ncbi:hypothetical protein HaLaN_19037, partial [Haematococcus lacustris]
MSPSNRQASCVLSGNGRLWQSGDTWARDSLRKHSWAAHALPYLPAVRLPATFHHLPAHFICGGMDMFERPPSKELVNDLLRTYLLGVLSSRLEQLLALLYKPAHITNAACETALKPLSSSGVEKMSPEQVAAHVKAHI